METKEATQVVKNAVEQWTDRIRSAKQRWQADFDRMRENMEFVAGLQWQGQKTLRCKKYVCNMTIQMDNQKVATLYAKNPQVTANRRKRLDFRLWDEKLESVQDAIMRVQMGMQRGLPDIEAQAVINDYEQGRQRQEIVDKVGKTLELLYQHQVDSQSVEFKEQMKQLVTTTVVCGVGY